MTGEEGSRTSEPVCGRRLPRGPFCKKMAQEWNFAPFESVNQGELSGFGRDHQGLPGRQPGRLEKSCGRVRQKDF